MNATPHNDSSIEETSAARTGARNSSQLTNRICTGMVDWISTLLVAVVVCRPM